MPLRTAVVLFSLAWAASAANAQVAMYQITGDSTNDQLGASVAGAGDVNNDGFDDFVVGAPFDAANGTARVYSGRTGATLYTFLGDSPGDQLGSAVSGAGDVNNDGFSDLIVGARGDDNNGTDSGSARVFSGATGAILYTFSGDSAFDSFGRSVSGAGDVNNDGFDDLIVGAFLDDNTASNSGSARVFSGATGAILYTFNGDSALDQFGRSVSGAGDVNNDGFDDLIVGAFEDDNSGSNSGSARVFSGATGAILYTFNGDSAADQLGISVSGAGDVNNDGFADLIAGAIGDDNNFAASGSARVFSGATGAILYTFNGVSEGDVFGVSVSGAGDVNSDGFDDLIIGALISQSCSAPSGGAARVHSGADGAVLHTFFGDSAGAHFGDSVSGAGDVNNDGYADLIVGAVFDDKGGAASGSVTLFYSAPAFAWQNDPVPCPGDTDASGTVDFGDLNIVLQNWEATCP